MKQLRVGGGLFATQHTRRTTLCGIAAAADEDAAPIPAAAHSLPGGAAASTLDAASVDAVGTLTAAAEMSPDAELTVLTHVAAAKSATALLHSARRAPITSDASTMRATSVGCKMGMGRVKGVSVRIGCG